MKYSNYNASDFVTEDSFILWVKTNDKELDEFWTEWIERHPGKIKEIELARETIEQTQFGNRSWSLEQKEKVKQKIFKEIALDKTENKRYRFKLSHAAVIVFFLFTLGSIWFTVFKKSPLIYETGYGETKELVFADSKITLSANSRLEYYESMWNDNREVKLNGEAFFQINKRKDNSVFVVRSGGITAKVIGTKFNVRSREQKTQVVLTSGKIQLTSQKDEFKHDPITVEPGELVEYKDQEIVRKELVDTALYTSLLQNMLVFEKTKLTEVSEQIRNLYGYTLHFPKDIQEQTFTTKFPLTVDGFPVLQSVLEHSFGIKLDKQEGNDLYFIKGE